MKIKKNHTSILEKVLKARELLRHKREFVIPFLKGVNILS